MKLLGLPSVATALLSYDVARQRLQELHDGDDTTAQDIAERKDLNIDSEMSRYGQKVKTMKAEAETRAQNESNEDALAKLKDKMTPEQREQVALVLKGKVAKEDDENTLLTKAVGVLNTMFLNVDEERVIVETNCWVDIHRIWRNIWDHWRTIRALETQMGNFQDKKADAIGEAEQINNEIVDQQGKIDTAKARMAVEMGVETDDLKNKEAEVTLYQFIVAKVDENCGKKAAFLQGGKKACTLGTGVSGALMNVFDQADVKAKVDELSHAVKENLQGKLNMLGANTDMDADETYSDADEKRAAMEAGGEPTSFLQAPVSPPGAACGPKEMDCDALKSIIGSELQCKQTAVVYQNMVIKELQDKHQAEEDKLNRELELLKDTLSATQERIAHFGSMSRETGVHRNEQESLLHELWHSSRERRFECYMRIMELSNNYYCSVKKLREFMKDVAIKKGVAKEEDIVDCEFSEHMLPDADCLLDGKQVDCIKGDKIPTDPNELPERIWRREIVTEPNDSVLALKCPPLAEMKRACNEFLCPVDCKLSSWGDWSGCSADCDGGSKSRIRSVDKMPKYGGEQCQPTVESAPCGMERCDADCVLHRGWWWYSRCLQACGPERFRLVHKYQWRRKKGQGKCPDKYHPSRMKTRKCWNRKCKNDEMCAQIMDLVIGYECSATVTKLGCYFLASFTNMLLRRMASHIFEFPVMKVGLVKFGNGLAVLDPNAAETKYKVAAASELSHLTGNIAGLEKLVMDDVFGLWTGKSKWHLGFNNIGQAVVMAREMLDASVRTGRPYYAKKKILLLTKGKRTECTEIARLGDDLQNDRIEFATILFASDYEENTKEYEEIEGAVTYPSSVHLTNVPGIATLSDWSKRGQYVNEMIPKICNHAFSLKRYRRRVNWYKIALVHYGRTCNAWKTSLGFARSARSCGNKAAKEGYKGFTYTRTAWWMWYRGGKRDANCFTDEEHGKKNQVDDTGKPVDETCTCDTVECTGSADKKTGWLNQVVAGGYWRPTSHYRVYMSETSPPVQNIFRRDGGEGTTKTGLLQK